MLQPINLEDKLNQNKRKALRNQEDVLSYYQEIFKDLDRKRSEIKNKLGGKNTETIPAFDFDKLDVDRIYHITQIEKICVDYRLRFLDTYYFQDNYPEEAITKINELEKEHNTKFENFKIVAPIDVFKLRKADDPLLFIPMGNGYYYLVHKWGNDINPFRKVKFWSVKNIENLLVALTVISVLFTMITYPFFIKGEPNFGYLLMLFMFYFKGVVGMFFIFFGSSGKNFSEYSWQSQYDKIH